MPAKMAKQFDPLISSLSLDQHFKKCAALAVVVPTSTQNFLNLLPPDAVQSNALFHAAQKLHVSGFRQGRWFEADDWVADEVPVALEFNGISHAVMLATPLNLDEFALGFALSEGIVSTQSELYGVDEVASELGITLKLHIASAAFDRLKSRRRSLAGRTGCGLCGTESLNHIARDLPALPGTPEQPAISRLAVAQAMSSLGALQVLHRATGAVHAAAWCSPQGNVQCLREDVGRHNALDKLIGALASSKVDPSAGFIAVTSRASFEMVQKTVSAGVPLLVAVSAPTLLAIKTAQRLHMTLVGFARQQDMVVFSHHERLDMAEAPHCHASSN